MLAIRGCLIIMPGNFSAFSWHYYIISILKKQVERTYFTNQAAASSFSFSSFLLFLYYNHSNNYWRD